MSTATIREPTSIATETEHIPDDMLYEVVDGQVVEKPVSAYSIWIASSMFISLGPYVRQEKLGIAVQEMVFVLRRRLKRRPDIAFVSADKWPIGQAPTWEGDWEIIPDLAIEVISPNNLYSNVVKKLREYFAAGVTEVWVAVPEERIIQVYRGIDDVRTVEAEESISSDLVPGWSMNVGELMPTIIPRKEEE